VLNAGEISSLVVAGVACLGALTAWLKAAAATEKAAAAARKIDDHLSSLTPPPGSGTGAAPG
jgi:hypothetical protein